MKKFLLLSMTVFSVLTMSAADRSFEPINKGQFNFEKCSNNHTLTAEKATDIRAAIKSGKAKRVAFKAPSQEEIYGHYIAEFEDAGDGVTPFTTSYPIEIAEYVYTDEASGESEVYVNFKGILGITGSSVLGIYQEDGTILIPSQEGFVDSKYGELYTVGFASVDGDSFSATEDYEVVLKVQEDENGYYIEYAEGCVGMGLYLANAEKAGEYAGQILTYEVGTYYNKANYMVTGEFQLKSPDAEEWEEVDAYPVFIESIDESTYYIHNLLRSNVEVVFDEEGNGTIDHNQKLYYNSKEDLWFYPCAWDIAEGGGINYNPDRDIKCFWSTSGKFLIADPIAMEYEYYVLGMEEGYYFPLYVATVAMPMDEYLAENEEGISDIFNPYTSKKTFNLAGQHVKNAEGIVIENGKKVIR